MNSFASSVEFIQPKTEDPGNEVGYGCTVVVMSYLVNMSSDVMWYASQSGHAIYRGSRGIGLEKNLRCSLVFEQNLQF